MNLDRLLSLGAIPALLGATLLVFCAGCGPRTEGVVIRLGHGLPEDHPVHIALMDAAKMLADHPENVGPERIVLRLFPNNQLGSSTDHVQMIASGQIDMGVISAAPLARVVPEMNALSLPFLFKDAEHQLAALQGPPGEWLMDSLSRHRMVGIGYLSSGSRNLMTKSPVRTPADLAGLNIRVMESNMLVNTIRAMGGSPVSMDMAEVYGALQQGVIDGWENNPPTAYFFAMHETGARHFSWTRHLMIPDVIVASASLGQRLTPEQYERLVGAFTIAKGKQWDDWQIFSDESVARLKNLGMEFHEVDETAFRARVAQVYEDAYSRHGEEFKRQVEAIMAMGLRPEAPQLADSHTAR